MKPLQKFILSFISAMVLTWVTVLVTRDAKMWLFLIMETVHVAFLALPLLFGAFRYGGFVSNRNAVYIFMCAANIWLGALSILLWFTHRFTADLPATFCLNLFAGLFALADVFITRRNTA